MKPFNKQFKECSYLNMLGKGSFKKWKDHPELLPLPWSRAAKLIAEEIEINPNAGVGFIGCKRFGGDCNSGNLECKELRMGC